MSEQPLPYFPHEWIIVQVRFGSSNPVEGKGPTLQAAVLDAYLRTYSDTSSMPYLGYKVDITKTTWKSNKSTVMNLSVINYIEGDMRYANQRINNCGKICIFSATVQVMIDGKIIEIE